MLAKILWYGFILPTDVEKMKSELLTKFGIHVKECRKDTTIMLVEDDSQVFCTLYGVPASTRNNKEDHPRLLSAAEKTILCTTMVKSAIVVDTMKDSFPSTSRQVAPAS